MAESIVDNEVTAWERYLAELHAWAQEYYPRIAECCKARDIPKPPHW